MARRPVRTEQERELALRYVGAKKLPFWLNVTDGDKRSDEQNRLQRLWVNEAAEQGDQTAEEYRGFCKLHFGVPILRNASDEFREKYDRIIKPLPYEQKLELMMEPFDFPVTRLMNTKQKSQYLDAVYQHFAGLGYELTDPEGR